MEVDREFWRGRRVLITGHTGFKGSWLTLFLRQLGACVSGVSLEVMPDPALYQLSGAGDGIESSLLDIRDYPALVRAVSSIKPEFVFHLAAQSLVRRSYQQPLDTYTTNVMGVANLLESVRLTSSVRAVVNVTSDKCYENREISRGYTEQDELGGYDPYSNSKACAELVTSAYRRSFFSSREVPVAIATARAGNVIGGGDWATDRLLVDAVRAFMTGSQVTLRNPAATRPWQHVFEPVRAYLLLAQRLFQEPARFQGPWNFGPHESDIVPVATVVDRLASVWGSGAGWVAEPGSHPHEAHTLRLDCTKARTQLGWNPVWGLERAIGETAAWYMRYANGGDMRSFSQEQIEAYLRESECA